jgi:tetratricopeptide (TPR) repeat protein
MGIARIRHSRKALVSTLRYSLAFGCAFVLTIIVAHPAFIFQRLQVESPLSESGDIAPTTAHNENTYNEGESQTAGFEPFFPGLEIYSRRVSTSSPTAQKYFDQGLLFLYGFNHEEASRSFAAACADDPECAMAYWGLSMSKGPHINLTVVDKGHAKAGWDAAMKAKEMAVHATRIERALIDAVCERWSRDSNADRTVLDAAYAASMRKVCRAFPNDPDVGALTAESILDLRPWAQWTADGKPEAGTEEVLGLLRDVLANSPKHPLGLHLWIHALEASSSPGKADQAAGLLRDLNPGIEHLLHMPSHIDVRRGRWREAIVSNERAIAADKLYWELTRREPVYGLQRSHNYHMLAFAQTMDGQSQKALATVDEMLSSIPHGELERNRDLFDYLFAMRYEVYLRFGRWDAMLAESAPRKLLPITNAFWHYARGIAYAARNQLREANNEHAQLRLSRKDVAAGAGFRGFSADELLDIADQVLAGEILYREAKNEKAIAALSRAIRLEDSLKYTEPPNWLVPVRHTLGATLLDANRYAEAEAIYREDLRRHPENGWSLYGLARSLKMQGRKAEAAAVTARFQEAWKYADFKISSSCCCLPDKNVPEK